MAYLHLELFGGFTATLDGGRPCQLPTRKAQALLAFLAVPAGRFHARDKLATLLWGDTPERQARQSFRQGLASLRRALQDVPEALMVRGDTIALAPEAVSVDVAILEAAQAGGAPVALDRAAALYKGDLLDGLRVDEPGFEEWLVRERERLRELALDVLARLLRQQLDADSREAAVGTALRLLAIDPLREEVHRSLMRLLVAQGRRAAALRQYQVCVGSLERELGAEPEEATRQLYREILRAAGAASGHRSSAPSPAPFAAATGGDAPLIGRNAETARLADSLTAMLDHGGRMVLLRGEAGIGKSRLIQDMAAQAAARGLTVVIGRCHETEQILPLQPWVDALRGERTALDAGLQERLGVAATTHLARIFPELLRSGDPPASTGEQYTLLFDALVRLVGELTVEQPLVMLLEDLHWSDALSARFLAFLGRRIGRLPLLVVGSMRPEELVDAPVLGQALKELRTDHHVEEIPLGPLSQADSRTLARALRPATTGDSAWQRLSEEIWSISEGNPFVIVESVRAFRDGTSEARGLESGLARGVRDFVADRLDRLSDRLQHVAAVGATIGRDFSFPLLMRAAGLKEQEAAEIVEELVRRRILDSVGDRLDFCHDWIRRVAYERLLPRRRAVSHAAVGAALELLHADELDEVADQLGHHYFRAGDADKAVPYLIRFGELAARRYALDDALRALGQAITVVRQLPAAERDRRTLDLVLRQAFVLSILGRQRDIAELLRVHAGHVKRVTDPLLVSEYHFRVGLTCFYLGDRARSLTAAEQALAQGERSGDAEAIGKALHVLSLSAFEAGRPREGVSHARRAIPLLDLPHAQAWFGLVHHDLALNCLMLGDLDAALAAARQEDAVGRSAEWPRVRALAGYVTAWVLALRGELEQAIAAANESLALSRDPMVASLVSGSLGFVHLEQGDGHSAVTVLGDVVERLRISPVRSGEARHLALLAEGYLLLGDIGRARATATATLELSQSHGMTFNTGLALRALGRIDEAEGKLPEAGKRLTQAMTTFASCDAAFEAARTQSLLAEVCARQGRESVAAKHAAAALGVFKAANAPRRAEALRVRARSFGVALLDA